MKSKQDISKLEILNYKDDENFKPLIEGYVAAGFPSPANDYLENDLKLKSLLIKNESSTFFVRAYGNSMVNEHICDGDILVVDKSLEPSGNSILVCIIDGEYTVKKVKKKGKDLYLIPANPDFNPIKIDEGSDFRLWGVVTFVIHKLR
jgi:DNA polymerase V